MHRERRLMKRAMALAAVVFAIGFLLPRDGHIRSEEDAAKPVEKAAAAPAFNLAVLFRETEETLRPPRPEKFREWAGGLLQSSDANAAKRLLERSPKPEPLALPRDLVRRGQYETAAALLEPMLPRSENPEIALLQIACRLGLGQPDLVRRPLILLESIRDPKAAGDDKFKAFVNRLVQMAGTGRTPNLEENPWGVKFLPDKSGTPSKPLPELEAAKLPADAEQLLSRWLQLAPMQPTIWAALGQIVYVRGDPADAMECFKRAKAMGYNSPLISEYLRLLEREESARRAAVLKQMNETGHNSPASEGSAPIAITGSSSRAFAAFGVGGLIVGFLIGVMAARRRGKVD